MYQVGDKVMHEDWGEGTVNEINCGSKKDSILVGFDKHMDWYFGGFNNGSGPMEKLTPIKEEPRMFASELMELARANPKEYEGKEYKVIHGAIFDADGNEHTTFKINSYLQCVSNGRVMYFSSDTKLEFIEPIPVSVPFMEAVNSRKRIKHVEWAHYYILPEVFERLGALTTNTATRLIGGQWIIEP